MAKVFISYKRVDKEKVFRIKNKIESTLNIKCWIDLDGIESDAQFKNVIINSINECEIVLFMYSKAHSNIVDIDNDWTLRELNFASKRKKRIVIINIDGSQLTDTFEFDYGTKQQIDGTSTESINKLINDIEKWLSIERNDIQITTKTSYLKIIHSKIEHFFESLRKSKTKRNIFIVVTVLFLLGYCNPSKHLEENPETYERDGDIDDGFNSNDDYTGYTEKTQEESKIDSSSDTELTISGNTDGHDWCDLGLPSGTIWATCNIGASTPYSQGHYFAWGETTTKDFYLRKNYIFDKHEYQLTKYCIEDELGRKDDKSILEVKDDAAYINWSEEWCIPRQEQIEELINSRYTISTWTKLNGVYGCLIKSKKNGNTIFLPASGKRDEQTEGVNDHGNYWSASLSKSTSDFAYNLYFSCAEIKITYIGYRYEGLSIRPVLRQQ